MQVNASQPHDHKNKQPIVHRASIVLDEFAQP